MPELPEAASLRSRSQCANASASGPTLVRAWSGSAEQVPCAIMRTMSARELWDRIVKATYEYSEPGVLFIDRINALNNLW